MRATQPATRTNSKLYNDVSYKISQLITLDYSTSFSSSTRLFSKDIRPHIYAIYGLVRIADEAVDTYRGTDAGQVLHNLEEEVYAAVHRGYSTNPVVQSFALTASRFGIGRSLIQPFFASMAMDATPTIFTTERYQAYIYGSAEVVGLMCLRVFVQGNNKAYIQLEEGARALGAAYQKVNFLRDMAADYRQLGRVYFPGVTFETFDDAARDEIIADIEKDFTEAKQAASRLPVGSRKAVQLSITYYGALLKKLKKTPSAVIAQKRVRINDASKAIIFSRAVIRGKLSGA